MELNNASPLRRMLEQQSTEVLQEMLNRELQADPVNGDSVRLILSVLRSRTPTPSPEMSQEVSEALERYQALVDQQDTQHLRAKKGTKLLLRTLSTAAVFVLVLAFLLPQEAEAGSIWKRLTRWTEEIVEFFTPQDNEHRIVAYEFKTEHPGLQEVHDTAVEMGITGQFIPMWIPEESELLECKIITTPSRKRLSSCFSYRETEIKFIIDKYDVNVSREFQKDNSEIIQHEIQDAIFHIMPNNSVWTVVWSQDNIECSLAIDCPEDILYRILNSIYSTEA